MNLSSLTDEELLVFVEGGNPAACREAAERLQDIVSAGYYRADEIDNALDEGRSSLANRLLSTYSEILLDLSDDESPLNQEQRQKLLNLRDTLIGES